VKVTSAKQKHVFEKVCEVKWIKCRSDEDEAAGKQSFRWLNTCQ